MGDPKFEDDYQFQSHVCHFLRTLRKLLCSRVYEVRTEIREKEVSNRGCENICKVFTRYEMEFDSGFEIPCALLIVTKLDKMFRTQ